MLTMELTRDERVWLVRASVDLTGGTLGLAAARRRLIARFGRPTTMILEAKVWLWLPRPASASTAGRCWTQAGMLGAARQTPGATLPQISPACSPLRSAIQAEVDGHTGLIVQYEDPALGLSSQR
ncbi:hypothetical protein ACSBM8_10185 [Sphingomonas sp. ASY06-1R]|uniref:hypothetical protein n=1 Tax=Sphingomonas sp. ASY06-1R TaxID=3445771 RepID=UPI003FA25037